MEEDHIISALIGLIGACNNNPKTVNTDHVVIKALALSLYHSEADSETTAAACQALIDEIHTEKNIVSPGCSTCQMPCGNTSDYDMNRIYDAEPEVRDIKLKILSVLKELAADIYNRYRVGAMSEESMDFFYKALIYVSLDMEKEGLLTFWGEAQDTIETIRRQIQE